MTNILVFLLILVILFGLEPTRAFIFGAFGFIFWAVVIFVVVVLIADAFTDKRTPEEKKKDEEAQKEKERKQKELEKASKKPLTWRSALAIFLIVAFLCMPFLLFLFY